MSRRLALFLAAPPVALVLAGLTIIATGNAAVVVVEERPDRVFARVAAPPAAMDRRAVEGRERVASAEHAAILETVHAYFDGVTRADVSSLDRAFHPDAVVAMALPAGLQRVPFAEWKRDAVAARDQASDWRAMVVAIDVAGNAAMIKTRMDRPGIRYTDFLSLLKVEGEWRIVNRVWSVEAG